jgi:phosphocarrier protein HPr
VNSTADGSAALRRDLKIVNTRGLHARAAAKFVKCAETFEADIVVRRHDMEVSGRSIMGLMMLAAAKGCRIEVEASGADAEAALEAIAALVEARFHED